jgi:hypothetical protein
VGTCAHTEFEGDDWAELSRLLLNMD